MKTHDKVWRRIEKYTILLQGKSSTDKQVEDFQNAYQDRGHTRKHNGRGAAVQRKRRRC